MPERAGGTLFSHCGMVAHRTISPPTNKADGDDCRNSGIKRSCVEALLQRHRSSTNTMIPTVTA